MAVIKNRVKDNFTQIPNDLLTDNRLSMGAKVVFCYVASKPTGWEVYNKEIQNALNIKDNATIAKYWKELLDAGWIERERSTQDSGKLAGGFDYILMIEPINRIGENPENEEITVNGKTPQHNNTDLINNTKINNNTNIVSKDTNNLDNNSNQLFGTPSKPKKKNENQFTTVIQELSANPKIRTALQKYCAFRRSRGLTVQQWQLIVEKFKEQSVGKTPTEIVECIERCIIDGCNSLYYKQPTQKNNFSNHPIPHTLSPEEDYSMF